MIKRKSVVLSDTDNSNRKAVLSLECDEGGLHGTVRLYNFSRDLGGISSLGFYIDKKVYKAGLTFKSPMLYEFFLDLEEIPQTFSCAVINFQDAKGKAILYGSSDGSDDVYATIINEISKDNTFVGTASVLDRFGVDYDEEEKEEIEKEIDKNMESGCEECDRCANCVYKQFFFAHNSEEADKVEINARQMDEKPDENEQFFEEKPTTPAFFDKLKPQIDKLFAENPLENNLQNLIPNSKWIKVDYEDDGDFYVFGLLYDENGQVKYVCYGVPGVFDDDAPKELSGYPIWIPLDKENGSGFGYWLTYQDAVTGQPIKAIIE